MKSLIFALSLLLSVNLSLAQEKKLEAKKVTETKAPAHSHTHDNVQLIKNIYDNFAQGNIEAVGAVMHEKVEWNEAENYPYADGNPYVGMPAILEGVFGRIQSEWEYWTLENLKFHKVEDNMVLVTGRYNAKYKKNGEVIDLQMAHLWTLDNGKVMKFQQYADTKGIADAMAK